MAEYFKDIDELEKVYVRMMETILREAQNIFFSNGMSLPEYQLLYAETDSRYALGNSKAIYRTLTVRYNQNVSFLDSNKDNLLVAPERVCRTLKANHQVIQDIEDFESVFSKQREELKKEYAEALEKKIPFWKFLDEEKNKHEAKEGDEVSFSTWAGQLICSFPAGGEEAI
jgi:hypothetical protein